MWVRFEGPGKERLRHWHMVEVLPSGRIATLCGHYVTRDEIVDERGDGDECVTCRVSIRTRPHPIQSVLAL